MTRVTFVLHFKQKAFIDCSASAGLLNESSTASLWDAHRVTAYHVRFILGGLWVSSLSSDFKQPKWHIHHKVKDHKSPFPALKKVGYWTHRSRKLCGRRQSKSDWNSSMKRTFLYEYTPQRDPGLNRGWDWRSPSEVQNAGEGKTVVQPLPLVVALRNNQTGICSAQSLWSHGFHICVACLALHNRFGYIRPGY